jgi:hypothetical protein
VDVIENSEVLIEIGEDLKAGTTTAFLRTFLKSRQLFPCQQKLFEEVAFDFASLRNEGIAP